MSSAPSCGLHVQPITFGFAQTLELFSLVLLLYACMFAVWN